MDRPIWRQAAAQCAWGTGGTINLSLSRGAGRVSGQGGQNSAQSAEKIFSFAHPGFSLPTLPYITVAHPAHRTEADLREKASLATNQEGPLPSPPSDLALQLGLVIHTPGDYRKTVTSEHYHASQKYTTFTTIRFITFTVSHIHTVTEPSTHCQSQAK